MTWTAEVAHIMRKDLRELRWVIAGYASVLVLATANALGWFGTHTFEGGMLVVVGLGMLLLASFVQSDSPTRPDAFWAAHPHRPSAVMASKLCSAAIIILLPALIGQYVALAALAVDGSSAARAISASAVVYLAWLLSVLVISAITPDLRTFILVIVVTPFALGIAAALFLPGLNLSVGAGAFTGILAIVGSLGLVAMLYRTRDTRRRTWLGAVLAIGCTAFTIVAAPPSSDLAAASATAPARRVPMRFTMGRYSAFNAARGSIPVTVTVDSALEGQRIVFTPTLATIRLVNGKSVTISARTGRLLLVDPKLMLGDGIVLPPREGASRNGMPFALQVRRMQAQFAPEDVAAMTIEGNVRTERASIFGSLPVKDGASLTHSGTRIDVDRARTSPESLVVLHVLTIHGDDGSLMSYMSGEGKFDVALVDQPSGTARPLYWSGSRGISGSMVLPGSGVQNVYMDVGVAPDAQGNMATVSAPSMRPDVGSPASATNTGTAWRDDARLTVIQWMPESNYSVKGNVVLRIDAEEAPLPNSRAREARRTPPGVP